MLPVSQCGKIVPAQDHTNFSDNKHTKKKKIPFLILRSQVDLGKPIT